MRYLLLLVALWTVPASASAQYTAVYKGRIYTPENYPQAAWHTDGMCINIRSQWAAQGWPHGFQATTKVETKTRQGVLGRQITRAKATTDIATAAGNFKFETRERTVTRTKRVKQRYCSGKNWRGQCVFSTRWVNQPYEVIETYQVKVPLEVKVEVKLQSSDLSSPAVATALFRIISPRSTDVVYDLGCGTGVMLKAAVPYGCVIRGVEIDKARADVAQAAVPSADVVHGDVMHQIYDDGTVFVIYQHSDLIAEVLPKLPAGTLVVSVHHSLPGVVDWKESVQVDGNWVDFYFARL